jgi:isoquinoline 1-oxidoreductase beta subunit
MSEHDVGTISRRQFIVSGIAGGVGLTLGLQLAGCSRQDKLDSAAGPGKAGDEIADAPFAPNAFVRIGTDDRVTVIIKHLEMGQGTYTGLATLVAEELDAAWQQIDAVGAPANARLYNNLSWGPMQGTGGSTAMANAYLQMRQAGAAARAMLVAAAASSWKVDESSISVSEGVLSHAPSGRRASFGELAEQAALQPVPEEVRLKQPAEFRLIGRGVPRKDSQAKTDGSAIFTQDIRLPGMLTALVAHPPRFGARVKSFDAGAAKAVKGVAQVVQIPNGVAVLATDFWSAKKGRDALSIDWDESQAFTRSSADIMADYQKLAEQPGAVARQQGDPAAAMQNAATRVQAAYQFPYLAHAAMEPMNCVVRLGKDRCEIWNGEQFQTGDQMNIASLLGMQPEQVEIHMLYAGGSFGRRANPASDYLLEAVHIARAIDGRAPVKLVWTREDDMRAGYFRPMYFHQLSAGLDEQGMPVAWQHRIVGQSIIAGTLFEDAMVRDGVDHTSVEGAANLPYGIANMRVDLHSPKLPVPVLWWRSVGSSHTAYSVETFIDELAARAGRDPLDYRRALLKDHPRHLGVLELAARKAGWGSPLPAGRGRGLAVHESFNSFVAQVVDVTLNPDNSFSVDRVVIAVDCGVAVNPDVIRAQMEGGMGFGLSAALLSEVTLRDGRVEQDNFDRYQVLRIDGMPEVEVHIVASDQPPTGVGEPATPVIAPAVANALASVSGRRYYALPLGGTA